MTDREAEQALKLLPDETKAALLAMAQSIPPEKPTLSMHVTLTVGPREYTDAAGAALRS